MSAPAIRYIVGTTAGHLTGLLALRDAIDAHFGPYPKQSTDSRTGLPVSGFDTKHHVNALPHPSTVGTYMFPLSASVKAFADAVVAAAVAAVAGGTATAAQTAIAALPAQLLSLDATWSVVPTTGSGGAQAAAIPA